MISVLKVGFSRWGNIQPTFNICVQPANMVIGKIRRKKRHSDISLVGREIASVIRFQILFENALGAVLGEIIRRASTSSGGVHTGKPQPFSLVALSFSDLSGMMFSLLLNERYEEL